MIDLITTLTSNHNQYYIYQRYIDFFKQYHINLVVMHPKNFDFIKENIDLFDGLILLGGDDVDPKFYHQTKHQNTNLVPLEIDLFELKLIALFYEKKIPIFGICRGMQVINVYFNGDLYQDVFNHHGTIHYIDDLKLEINSYHHQAVKTVCYPLNKIIEFNYNIEAIGNYLIFAVQWHPELAHGASNYFIVELLTRLIK